MCEVYPTYLVSAFNCFIWAINERSDRSEGLLEEGLQDVERVRTILSVFAEMQTI